MGIVNYILISLVINSNLYVKSDISIETDSINLAHLEKMILSIGSGYPLYFELDYNHTDSLKVIDWFNYLDAVHCKKVLLVTKENKRSIEVVKENGFSDSWYFHGKTINGNYSYVLKKNKYAKKTTRKYGNIDYHYYISTAKKYITDLDKLVIMNNGQKACPYFENKLRIFSQKDFGPRNIPSYGLSHDVQVLLYLYETSGDFITYRGWNPFQLEDEKEKELYQLYLEYQIFRYKMLEDLINSI